MPADDASVGFAIEQLEPPTRKKGRELLLQRQGREIDANTRYTLEARVTIGNSKSQLLGLLIAESRVEYVLKPYWHDNFFPKLKHGDMNPHPKVLVEVNHLRHSSCPAFCGENVISFGLHFSPLCSCICNGNIFQVIPDEFPRSHVARRLGIPGLNWQVLRRSYATWLVQSGADVKSVQGQMRHTDPKLAMLVYAQIVPAAQRRAVTQMMNMLDSRRMPVNVQ